MTETQTIKGYYIVELMGHRRLAGLVTEQTIAGAGFLRIDVPGDDGAIATQFFAPASVYAMTPTTEAVARDVAKGCRVAPVTEWDLPQRRALPAVEEAGVLQHRIDAALACETNGCGHHFVEILRGGFDRDELPCSFPEDR